jgi:hypothetical protein
MDFDKDSMNVSLEAFKDTDDQDQERVFITVNVQMDASVLLSEVRKLDQNVFVQAEKLVDAIKSDLEVRLYGPLWQRLKDVLKK